MGMNVNFRRTFLRMPENVKNEEDIKKNLEYKPQALKAEVLEPGNMQPKTPTPSQEEIDAFLQNYEQCINNPAISWDF